MRRNVCQYFRLCLSYCNVEELLFERMVIVMCEAIRITKSPGRICSAPPTLEQQTGAIVQRRCYFAEDMRRLCKKRVMLCGKEKGEQH